MTHDALAELQRLLDAATPGPWLVSSHCRDLILAGKEEGSAIAQVLGPVLGSPEFSANAALIVAAINALPQLLAELTAANARVKEAQAENTKLVADLAKFDAEVSCEGCGAPLFDGDDFVTGPEDGCSGCWAAMTDLPSKRERACYAYRVGKASAVADREGRSDG